MPPLNALLADEAFNMSISLFLASIGIVLYIALLRRTAQPLARFDDRLSPRGRDAALLAMGLMLLANSYLLYLNWLDDVFPWAVFALIGGVALTRRSPARRATLLSVMWVLLYYRTFMITKYLQHGTVSIEHLGELSRLYAYNVGHVMFYPLFALSESMGRGELARYVELPVRLLSDFAEGALMTLLALASLLVVRVADLMQPMVTAGATPPEGDPGEGSAIPAVAAGGPRWREQLRALGAARTRLLAAAAVLLAIEALTRVVPAFRLPPELRLFHLLALCVCASLAWVPRSARGRWDSLVVVLLAASAIMLLVGDRVGRVLGYVMLALPLSRLAERGIVLVFLDRHRRPRAVALVIGAWLIMCAPALGLVLLLVGVADWLFGAREWMTVEQRAWPGAPDDGGAPWRWALISGAPMIVWSAAVLCTSYPRMLTSDHPRLGPPDALVAMPAGDPWAFTRRYCEARGERACSAMDLHCETRSCLDDESQMRVETLIYFPDQPRGTRMFASLAGWYPNYATEGMGRLPRQFLLPPGVSPRAIPTGASSQLALYCCPRGPDGRRPR